jgi:hypothetical protein
MRQRKHALYEQNVVDHNARPPESFTDSSGTMVDYYSRMEEDFDATRLTQRVYAKESESLQDWIKRLWYQYGFVCLW